MNWEAIGAVGEVGGAIAVVATLVYLAAQIRHSSNSTRASTQASLMSEFNRALGTILAHPHLAEMSAKSRRGEALNPIEAQQFGAFTNQLVNIWVSIEQSNRLRALDPLFFEQICNDVRRATTDWPAMGRLVLESSRNIISRN